ncbi:MAG: hypothetical protein ACREAB_04005 [Blastocatellia bacterium]
MAQLLRPYPQFGNVVSYTQNEAHSSYHSFQLTVWRRVNNGLIFSAGYGFSKSIDDLTSMSLNNQTIRIQYYQDYHNRRADKSLSNFDVTHRFIRDVNISANSKADRIRQYFNVAAFAQSAPYNFGNAPRPLPNLRSPDYFTTNLSLQRDFRFTETARLQIRYSDQAKAFYMSASMTRATSLLSLNRIASRPRFRRTPGGL